MVGGQHPTWYCFFFIEMGFVIWQCFSDKCIMPPVLFIVIKLNSIRRECCNCSKWWSFCLYFINIREKFVIRRPLFCVDSMSNQNRVPAETKVIKCHVCWEVKNKNVVFVCCINLWERILGMAPLKCEYLLAKLSVFSDGRRYEEQR